MPAIDPQIEDSWKKILGQEFAEDYFYSLKNFLVSEKRQYMVYPPSTKIFEAFSRTPFEKVKVVIIGQDPYHGPGQAEGLCFSVPSGIKPPPSLLNIFKELERDFGYAMPSHGHLGSWTEQGVFLLNATLTVRANMAGSHQNQGWERFTDMVIKQLSTHRSGLIFLLWGAYAQKKAALIDTGKHHILTSVHPSPLSAHRGFIGCGHFSKANEILLKQGDSPINWEIPSI